MRLIRKGKKSSTHETHFLHMFYNYIIPQDFGFVPRSITFQIIDTNPAHVSFVLTFKHESDLYRLDCGYDIKDCKTSYRLQVQCGM